MCGVFAWATALKNTQNTCYCVCVNLLFACGVIDYYNFFSVRYKKKHPNLAIHSNVNGICYPSTAAYCTCLLALPISNVSLRKCRLLTCQP